MPRRDPFPAGSFVHVFNRGFDRQQLFFDQDDYLHFLKVFRNYLRKYKGVILKEYCIIPNHFHFVFLNKRYGFDIFRLIGKVCAAYCKYFESTCGKQKGLVVFSGRFNANILPDERAINKCRFYVRYNAVKHKLVKDMRLWPYSSFHENYDTNQEKYATNIINFLSQDKKLEQEYEWEDEEESNIDT